METTRFKVEKKKKKEMVCKYCIFLQIEKGYTQIYVNDDRKWKKNVEEISFFCKDENKKNKRGGKYITRASRYKSCNYKQTTMLEDCYPCQ